MTTAKILAFAGSTRKDSYNKKLIKIIADGIKGANAAVTLIDLKDFSMPLYDGDIESGQGLPKAAQEFKKLMYAHDGFVIAAPEYNSSMSGVLKNTLDWASRKEGNEAEYTCFAGKCAAICSASPSALGGLRGLVHLRSMLSNMYVIVMPYQFALMKAHEAFDEQGRIKDPKQTQLAAAVGSRFVELVMKLKNEKV